MMQKRIAFLTDTHLGDKTPASYGIDARKNLETVLEDIAHQNIDGLIFGGDITEPEEYQWFFSRLEQAHPDYKAVLGNHDDFKEAVKYFCHPSDGRNELYYSEEDDYYRYIYLDSSSAGISDTQITWLKEQLNTSKPPVVFIHHPVLGLGTAMDRIYPLKNRVKINDLLQQCNHPVTIFCGHYHMEDTRTDGNVTQHTTPAVSFQVKRESQSIEIYRGSFGYRLIDITETFITTKLVLF